MTPARPRVRIWTRFTAFARWALLALVALATAGCVRVPPEASPITEATTPVTELRLRFPNGGVAELTRRDAHSYAYLTFNSVGRRTSADIVALWPVAAPDIDGLFIAQYIDERDDTAFGGAVVHVRGERIAIWACAAEEDQAVRTLAAALGADVERDTPGWCAFETRAQVTAFARRLAATPYAVEPTLWAEIESVEH